MSLSAKRGHPRTAFNLIRLSFRRLIWVGLWCLVYGLSFIAPTPAQQLKITFIVTDVDNKPVPNAQIKIARSGKSVSTNCDGTPIVAVSQPGRSGGTPNATPTPTLPDLPATGESYTTNAQGVFVMPNEKDFPANQAPYKITVTDKGREYSSELSEKLLQSLIVCDEKKTGFITQPLYFPIQLNDSENTLTFATSLFLLDKQAKQIEANQTYMFYGLLGLGLLSMVSLILTRLPVRIKKGSNHSTRVNTQVSGGNVEVNTDKQNIKEYLNELLRQLDVRMDERFNSLEKAVEQIANNIKELSQIINTAGNRAQGSERSNQLMYQNPSQPISIPSLSSDYLAQTHLGEPEMELASSFQNWTDASDPIYSKALDAYRAAKKGENVAPDRYLDPASSNAGYGKTELKEATIKGLSSFWLFLSNEQEGWVIPNVRNISPNIASVFPSLSSGQLPPEIRPARATLDIHRMVWQVESQR